MSDLTLFYSRKVAYDGVCQDVAHKEADLQAAEKHLVEARVRHEEYRLALIDAVPSGAGYELAAALPWCGCRVCASHEIVMVMGLDAKQYGTCAGCYLAVEPNGDHNRVRVLVGGTVWEIVADMADIARVLGERIEFELHGVPAYATPGETRDLVSARFEADQISSRLKHKH